MPFDPAHVHPSEVKTGPRGWYSRGYLPHFDAPGVLQFVTFHEIESVPRAVLDRWREELAHLPKERRKAEEHRRIMRKLDESTGPCRLRQPQVARIVEDALLTFHGQRYDLEAWTVMPNHVHMLVRFYEGQRMGDEIKGMKGASARRVNGLLGTRGSLWYREFYDRYIRDENHYSNVVRYIDWNPVKARLCSVPEEWPFGSARFRRTESLAKPADRSVGAPS